MNKTMKRIMTIEIIVLLILATAAVGVVGFWQPYNQAISSVGTDKSIQLYQQEDGSVALHWAPGVGANQYLLEILDSETQAVQYNSYISGEPRCVLSRLPDNPCTIRIRTVVEYHFWLENEPRFRLSEDAIEVTDRFVSPLITDLVWTPDPESDQLAADMTVADGTTVLLYELSGTDPTAPVSTYTDGQVCLSFGEGAQWPMPLYGESYTYALDSYREGPGYIFYGLQTESVTLTRQDLLGTDLDLVSADNGNNTFTLTWNETKGDYYELQCRSNADAAWETVLQVGTDAEKTYTTEALKPYSYREYRLQAWQTGEAAPLLETASVPVQMGAAIVYSTIWPIQDLEVYTDTQKSQVLGTAAKGTAFCILAQSDGMFHIRFGDGYGYIDSNYCMINLAECMGELCKYDIANSYASVFKIHNFDIPGITGQVVTGYESVELSEGRYLVPLLYPVLEKLENAAISAKNLGYTLKIYESFRPQKTTHHLYDETLSFTEDHIPEDMLTEEDVRFDTSGPVTYAKFMTDNGRYAMNYFLAKGRSRHNQGIALDLTLENAEGEVAMQTAIHDLSWYSETAQNNESAGVLAQIMTGAGFNGLVSEWWHFQDDDALKALSPEALWEGVSPQCWMADTLGWFYRTADGSYLTNCTETIDGTRYVFDEQGYATRENEGE